MRKLWVAVMIGLSVVVVNGLALASPYRVLQTAKVGGEGGFDYVYADEGGRTLYVPRSGTSGRITVFNLDSLKPLGEISNTSAHGVVVSPKSNHGFSTSQPIVMWDAKTLTVIKTIKVSGSPDGLLYDSFNDHVYIFSHQAPNVTVLDAVNGSIVGTIDLGGAPEQAATDARGRIYVDIEDQNKVAVIDVATLAVVADYSLDNKGGTCAGLSLDAKNDILFVACRNPATMVVLNAKNGQVLTSLPIGQDNDGVVFNPNTLEAISSQADGTLTVIKEASPTSFQVEQTLTTMPGAKTLTLDAQTNRLFLITAEFSLPPATAQTGQRVRHGPMIAGSFAILVVGK
jgi:DNA-binding beta-propeller fold protein YncE